MRLSTIRPLLWAVGFHGMFVLFLVAIQAYKAAIPGPREFEPLEVMVMGDIDLEHLQKKARPRVKLNDFKEGVVVSDKPTKNSGGLGGLLQQATQLSRGAGTQPSGSHGKLQSATGAPGQAGEKKAFALLAKSMRNEFFENAEKSSDQAGFKVIDKLPERIRGVQWKQLPPPEVKADTSLSVQDMERLRLMFASKWVEVRDCYEQALLHDEKLAGYIHIRVQVGSRGRAENVAVELRGDGSNQSQRVLKGCISHAAEIMTFFDKLRGQTLQVGYRLRS